jgi:16S rRNA pseudouridine516 synthase
LIPRLDQLLASLGYGSRREARALIESGHVSVRGKASNDHERRVDPSDVRVDGEPLDHPDGLLLLLHKPAGLVCSHNALEGPAIYGLLPARWRRRNPPVTSVGRLDKETTGLLLLTDQSELVHRLTSPKRKVTKVYTAVLDREPAPGVEALFASGQFLLPGESAPCAPVEMRRLGALEVEVTLVEGRYHQVRRMFAAQSCQVLSLHRARFGDLDLGTLPPGKWIELPLNHFQ